jgi:hypothetical protein
MRKVAAGLPLWGSTAGTNGGGPPVSAGQGRFVSATIFASCHDGRVQAIAQIIGHLVDLVATIDLNRLLGGVEDDFAVAALLKVLFDFSACLGGN